MEDSDKPSVGANQPTLNEDAAAAAREQYYHELQSHLQIFLPFLIKVKESSEILDIPPDRASKLQILYDLVDGKRLLPDRLKTCRKVFYDLYDKYSKPLNYYLQPDFKTSWIKDIALHEEEKKISSEGILTCNKCKQTQSCMSETSIKAVSSANNDQTVNNELLYQDNFIPNNENTSDKSVENVTIGEGSRSINSKSDIEETFPGCRLRLNKLIGIVENASWEKLIANVPSTSNADLPFEHEFVARQINFKNMLKEINLDNIDVNYIREVIEGIKKANVDSVQPPLLSPLDLMDLGGTKVNSISTSEPNSNEVTPEHDLSSKSTSIHTPLNTEINKLPMTGSSNKTNQKFISALKPGTLIDLENSKVSRASLHIESLRPVNKLNEKNVDLGVCRDPRIRHKSLLSLKNSINPIYTPSSSTSNGQNNVSSSVQTFIAPNVGSLNTTMLETKAQEMAGFNVQSSSSHTNIQLLNPQFSSEHNRNSNQFINNRLFTQNQNRHNRNDHQKNESSQFNNSTQVHVKLSHSEPKTKYCEPVPYKFNGNIVSKRDPRSTKTVSKTSVPQFRSFKEYRQAKYGNKGFDKNQKQISKDNNQYQSSVNENNEKKNSINIPFNTFGNVNETANIKSFKIPKIKHDEVIIDNGTVKDTKHDSFKNNNKNADVLKTETKCTKLHLNTDTVNELNIAGSEKTKIKEGNNNTKKNKKKTDKMNDIQSEKNLGTELFKNSSTDTDLSINTKIDHNSEKDKSCPETNLGEIIVKNKFNKDELVSKSEQSRSLNEPTTLSKPKKSKKYSKEKEFEKIVKEAVESSNHDGLGPRTRTRSSLLKKDETLKTLKVNSTMQKTEKNITIKNNVQLVSGECSKDLENLSNLNVIDINGPIETGLNIISSTSKEQSGMVNSTTEILCKSKEKNVISSNEINSTADTSSTPTIDDNMLCNFLKNPKFMNLISLFQDEEKLDKLNKLLEISNITNDITTNDDKFKNKDLLNEQVDIDKQKKIKKKMKKEKRKRRKMKKNFSGESSNEEFFDCISNDTDLKQAEITVKTTKKISHLNELKDEGNTSCGNIYDIPLDQHELKPSKRKKSKESYGNFEILKDKFKPELKDLKIVIAKFDKNTKRSENSNSDSSVSHDIQTTNEPVKKGKTQKIKTKKSFYGPLSVKLAKQKLETERNNSQIQIDDKNQVDFKTKNDSNSDKNKKSLISPFMEVQPTAVFENVNELNPDKSAVQKPKLSAVIEPNVKKSRLSELDKLHADISEMYDCAALLKATNIRQCRTNKQVDYVNTNLVASKKKKTSNMKQLDSNDGQRDKLICSLEKPKTTKKKFKKSILKLNKKKHLGKRPMKNQTLAPITVNTAVMNKMPNTFKENEKQLNNSINKVTLPCDTLQLNNESENIISTEKTSQVVSENKFKDKSYFQSADNILECKSCNYNNTGLNIVRHYKDQHAGEEVLPSRLSKSHTESLIHQSLKEQFEHQNSQDSKLPSLGSLNINYTCVFCQVIFHDYFDFYDHITGHTGEYRYKCKMCEKRYSNKDELEKHIIKHADYDRTDGISYLLLPNLTQSKTVFGYLCSFCYYIQLDYSNIVKHMEMLHLDEDKKLNGHWTVLRISMSVADKNYTNSKIDFDSLVGCLPPIQADQPCSKNNDNENKNQRLTVSKLNAQSKNVHNSIFPIKNECNKQQDIVEILSESNIERSPSELSIIENPPDLIIDENPPESNINKVLSESVIDVNPPESVVDKNLPVSDMLQFSPKQVINQSPRISTQQLDIEYSRYTLKEKSTKYVLAGLSCELINSMLLFKCSVSNCLKNQFSTVVLTDFFEHIKQNHHFVAWDGNCEICHQNFENVSEQYYMESAYKHLVSHHLVLRLNEQLSTMAKPKVSKIGQSLSSKCQDNLKNTPTIEKPFMALRVRDLPGDTLSNRKPGNSSISQSCDLSVNISPSDGTNSNKKNDQNVNEDFREKYIVNNHTSGHTLIDNQCEIPVNLNIDQGSNDGGFPLLSPLIYDVMSLKKGEVTSSKMNSSASNNNDLDIWMKSKTSCELILPNSELLLETGQQIVNNGVPIDGTFCLIDTAYKKDYLKKIRDLPMNVMKTRIAFKEMSGLPRLLNLFKCMDRFCSKSFSSKELFKLHMKLHFSNAEKRKSKKNQIYNVEQFKMCAYCLKAFDNEESLANHIAENYTFCEYFCPHCFYRAYIASHVLVHQSIVHKISKHCIIKLEYDETTIGCEYPNEILRVVDFKEFVLPYICNVGRCTFSCYVHTEFIEHLSQGHQQCDKFFCYICAHPDDSGGFFALHPNAMITHFKLHNLNKYQCIFCLFGNEVLDSMIEHLAMEHFECEPLCLERFPVSDNCDSKNIKNLKILKLKKIVENGIVETVNLPAEITSLPEVMPQRSKKRSIECPNVISTAMKSACIDELSQPSDTIVITVPDSAQMEESSVSLSLPNDSEFIMLDDTIQNVPEPVQETLKINRIWTISNNKEKEPQESSNDSIIVIDDDDDDDISVIEGFNEVPSKRKCLDREESSTKKNKAKRLAFPIIELDKLFVCKECDKVFSNGEIYNAHLNECPFWDNASGNKCLYCAKVFKNAFNMTEHIKLHGPDRFKCYLCNLNVPSGRAITHHMKNSHNILNLNFVPERPELTNFNKDNFIVFENKTVKQTLSNSTFTCNKCPFKGNNQKVLISHMKIHNVDCEDNSNDKLIHEQPNNTINPVNVLLPEIDELQQNTSLKRKRSNNFGNQKKQKAKPIQAKTKNLLFSPDTIDSIPKSHIFSDPIGCLLCTYNTKVRSNLIIHLNGHTEGQDNTTKEIVNPVPSIGKSELMFDKMINLSASSFDAMNVERMKIDELNKKIVEVTPDDNFNTEIFPQFIPKNMRFKCSIPRCDYTGMTQDMLKTHISILHRTYQCYICPHCLPSSSCTISKVVERNQIEFHLMHHGANLYSCQYCKYIDFNRVEMRAHMRNTHLSEITSSIQSNIIVIRKEMLEDDSIDRGRSKAPSTVPQWVCNICSTGIRYTEIEITSHIFMVHNVSNMYKCPMCPFEHNDDNSYVFEEHYKLKHPSVAVKWIRVFERITDEEKLRNQPKALVDTSNLLEQQALESLEPTLFPPTCRGIPIESTPIKTFNKSRGKSPKSASKNSSIQPHTQKTLTDVFNKDDELGAISSNGHFACPKCNVFETTNIGLFRDHLYKEVNYKTWKCLKCFEISDSPKKMAWHVKKHGTGIKYEKIEDSEKFIWVDRVIVHQNLLLTDLHKNSKAKCVKSVESSKTVIVNNKRTSSPTKKKNIDHEKKVLVSRPSSNPIASINDDIIDLVDDSDDE